MSLRISENKSAFVQKLKSKEAISSPREVGHTLTSRQNCPLLAMYALNLQEVSSSTRSLQVMCLNEALRNRNLFFLCNLFPSLMAVSWVQPKSRSDKYVKVQSI